MDKTSGGKTVGDKTGGATAFQDHYPDDVAHCYGCGCLNARGHQIKTYWASDGNGDETVTHFTPRPEHTAIPGYVYGGLLASLIDCHGTGTAAAAAYRWRNREMGSAPPLRFVTASLQVDYLKPTPLGVPLEIRGRIEEIKEKKVVVMATVFAGGEATAKGRIVAVLMPDNMMRQAAVPGVSGSRLGKQLAREAREYLADLRDILEGLRSVEGWIALGLLVAAMVITAVWALFSLGFSPPNEHVTRFIYKVGMRPCRPVDNLGVIIIFVNLFLLLFLTVISLGNIINLINRVKQHLPREPRDLIVSTTLMLVVGIGGIIYMRQIC